jgi:hypothetical protein
LGVVVVPPGTEVPPLGVVVDVVPGAVLAVGSVSFAVEGFTEVLDPPVSFESSPATMIRATPRPITRQISSPMIQRVRESTLRI